MAFLYFSFSELTKQTTISVKHGQISFNFVHYQNPFVSLTIFQEIEKLKQLEKDLKEKIECRETEEKDFNRKIKEKEEKKKLRKEIEEKIIN